MRDEYSTASGFKVINQGPTKEEQYIAALEEEIKRLKMLWFMDSDPRETTYAVEYFQRPT